MAHDNFAMRALGRCVVPRVISNLTKQQGVWRKPVDMVLRDVERHLGVPLASYRAAMKGVPSTG